MRPEPSVVEVLDGRRMPADWLGMASASRFDSEKRTEFSLRWPVKWVEPELLPFLMVMTGSAGWVAPPNKKGDEGAAATGEGTAGAAAAEANKSAEAVDDTTVCAANGSLSPAGWAVCVDPEGSDFIELETRPESRAAGLATG